MAVANEVLAGAIGGLAGGMTMDMGMLMGKNLGLVNQPFPYRVEQELEQRAGVASQTGPAEEQVLMHGIHLGLSAAFDAGYGLFRRAFSLNPVVNGLLYSLGLYVINLGLAAPAIDLSRGPLNERPMTVGRRIEGRIKP